MISNDINKIIDIVGSCIGGIDINEKDIDRDLLEIGIDSIVFQKIIISIEEEFNYKITSSKLVISELNTIEKISHVVSEIMRKIEGI